MGRPSSLLASLCFAPLLACAAASKGPPSPPSGATDGARASEHCQMAMSALDAVIKRWNEQPLGLDRACVERVAAVEGRIHADARFTVGDQLQVLDEPGCADQRFTVRFGPASSQASPTSQVVLLTLWSQLPAAWDFNAVVDVPTWPTRRPGTSGLPVCGAAFGILRRPGDSWVATLVPPPRSRAQMELGR
jgi:hypothetical protein